MKVKNRKLTLVIKYLYALFLAGTGIMTLAALLKGIDLTQGVSLKTAEFMHMVTSSSYLIPWIGIFKIITGILLAIPRTSPLGAAMAFPYACNILLYVIFIAHQDYLILGLVDFSISVFLVYAFSDYYKPMLNYGAEIEIVKEYQKQDN